MSGESGREKLAAFRLVGGPCDGQVGELPLSGYDETWRHVAGSDPPVYAEYRRAGAVFRYAGRTVTREEMVALVQEHEALVTVHRDSREYER